jgi:YHS domain-containing protein
MKTVICILTALALLAAGAPSFAAASRSTSKAPAKQAKAQPKAKTPAKPKAPHKAKLAPKKAEVRCPVTGEKVTDIKHAAKSVYKGKTYYFCCPACKPQFDKNPEKYIKKAPAKK